MPCAPPDQNCLMTPREETLTRVTPPAKAAKPVDIAGVKALRDSQPYQEVSGTDMIREMRDSRY